MLRGLWRLTWLEIKIFAREPLGLVGTIAMPVVIFIFLGRALAKVGAPPAVTTTLVANKVPVLASLFVAINAVLSLVTIIAIYREGGILKRLRATPLRPYTILAAHVLAKLLVTAVTLTLMVAAGKRYYPVNVSAPILSFTVAMLIATFSILSIGFVIASIVPTARFAQPVGAIVLYPMIGLSGLFVPLPMMPPTLQLAARFLPLTYAVSLLEGIWKGDAWSQHAGDVLALVIVFGLCIAISSRVFRWE